MWVFNLRVQEKLSCLEKTLGTMESLNSPPGHLQTCSSLCLLLVSFFSFFFFKSVSNRAMKMMILEQTLQCNNKLMQRMMIIHS